MSSRGISEGLQYEYHNVVKLHNRYIITGRGHTGMVACIVPVTPSAFDIHPKLGDH